MQVLLATCFDDTQLQELKGLDGQYVRLDMDPLGNVSATAMEASQGEMRRIVPSIRRAPSSRLSLCVVPHNMDTSAFALAAHEQGLAKTHASVIGVSDSALALKVLACEQPNGAKCWREQQLLARLQRGRPEQQHLKAAVSRECPD